MWLDVEELDQLENIEYAKGPKGTLMLSSQLTQHPCPHCGAGLRQFQYRMYSLMLDYCENQHGFWLDAGEDERVLQLMRKRALDMQRKFTAEEEWDRLLHWFRSKSSWQKN